MKPHTLIRTSLLTGVCVAMLTGCSWLEDWPPNGGEKQAQAEPPSSAKLMKTADSTWLSPAKKEKAVAVVADAQPSKGMVADAESGDRIAILEAEMSQLRNDISLMLPALTKLAQAQGGGVQDIEPAAGAGFGAGGMDATPGTVGWYEAQEKQDRQQRNQRKAQSDYLQPASASMGQPSAPVATAQPYPVAGQPVYHQQPQAAPQQPQRQVASVENYMNSQGGNSGYQQQNVAQGYGGQQQYNPPMQQQQQQAYMPPQYPHQMPHQASGQQQSYGQQQAAPQATYQQAAYNPPPVASGPTIKGVRFGEHPDKTRIVLDASDSAAFSYDLDNNERILMITLPNTNWRGAESMSVTNSPLVSSYTIVTAPNGAKQMIVQLRSPIKVLWAQSLPPSAAQGNRIVVDIAPI